MKLVILLLLLLFVLSINCNEKIKVHLICHSHCDLGWLKTVDEYYNNDVSKILTNVVDSLNNNTQRKFVWSEIGYLEQWWKLITQDQRELFKKFVKEKRLEIVNGGWVMNDEACASVDDVIRQLTEGHRFIVEQFGEDALPKSGWQIDPFGHSNLTPYIQSQMGYRHVVLDRLDYRLKDQLKDQKDLQFLWRNGIGSVGDTNSTDMFAHVLDDFYFSPPHLSFELESNLDYYDLKFNILDIRKYAEEKRKFFQSPHILIPIGGDFHFRNAQKWMDRIDLIEKVMEEEYQQGLSNIVAVYSTLADFFNDTITWHRENSVPFKYYQGDFFPYADKPDEYWTGYYTSRPKLKGQIRDVSSKLRSAEIISSLLLPNVSLDHVQLLKEASQNLSVLQHHDAVTGTAREHVVQDYFSRISDATHKISKVFSGVLKSGGNNTEDFDEFEFNILDVRNHIKMSKGSKKSMVLVNSLNWLKQDVVSLKIQYDQSLIQKVDECPFSVIDSDDSDISIDCSVKSELQLESPDNSPLEIVYFQLDFYIEIPALSIKTIHILQKHSKRSSFWVPTLSRYSPKSIDNRWYRLVLKDSNSLLESIHFLDKHSERMTLNQKIMYYNDIGGAYVFKNDGQAYEFDHYNATVYYWDGSLVKEIHVYYRDEFPGRTPHDTTEIVNSLIKLRIYNSSIETVDKRLYFQYILDSKSSSTRIVRFSTSLQTDSVYSDNGIQLLQRDLSKDPLEPYKSYYPSISIAMVRNGTGSSHKDDTCFLCTSDRTKGIGSLRSGEFEMALHRNLERDDQKGLEEPNHDYTPVQVQSQCFFSTYQEVQNGKIRRHALELEHPIRFYSINPDSSDKIGARIDSSLLSPYYTLPDHIHILSIDKRDCTDSDDSSLNIRLWNIKEIDENPTVVNLQHLFSSVTIDYIKVMTLSNLQLNDNFKSHQEYFSTIPYQNQSILNKNFTVSTVNHNHHSNILQDTTIISILPLEIKSLFIKFVSK
ncbi:alpha-mannosidase [Tieghemostelium lacteum]|uniref:Alpha-mannosidase n=1 Tax=Tieghemostelium lacteum TaxID=361077 RepID=A0A151ZC91_TIELA|nr:alpha-mannosidase [Tieghemostelium lacteum]|eukprot:KYQ91545.1 alpha-mannosidase [Tieghemostelium lacteum]